MLGSQSSMLSHALENVKQCEGGSVLAQYHYPPRKCILTPGLNTACCVFGVPLHVCFALSWLGCTVSWWTGFPTRTILGRGRTALLRWGTGCIQTPTQTVRSARTIETVSKQCQNSVNTSQSGPLGGASAHDSAVACDGIGVVV